MASVKFIQDLNSGGIHPSNLEKVGVVRHISEDKHKLQPNVLTAIKDIIIKSDKA